MQIGELLQEIFCGGPSISLTLKDDQIWRIFRLLFSKGKEYYAERNAALLGALNELLMVMNRLLANYSCGWIHYLSLRTENYTIMSNIIF